MLATLKSQFTVRQAMYMIAMVAVVALMLIPDFAHAVWLLVAVFRGKAHLRN
jgi:hypothetical protein